MKFVNLRSYQKGDISALEVLYDNKEGRHEIYAEGKTPKQCLLNLLSMVVEIAQNDA